MFFFLALALWSSTVSSVALPGPSIPRGNFGRTLAAATRRFSLLARSNDLDVNLKNKVELVYAGGNNHDGERNFAATVTLASNDPILVLEEVEHLLDELRCSTDSITLSIPKFGDTSVLEKLHKLIDGHIITAHFGCNADLERQAYRVVGVETDASCSVTFGVVPVSFKSAFSSIEVDIGYTEHAHELRTRELLRQDIDRYRLSLDGLSVNNSVLISQPGNFPVDISCKNCSLRGGFEFESVNIRWTCDSLEDMPDIDSPSDCISGRAVAVARGFGARMKLEASISNTWEKTIELLPPDLLPDVKVTIPGIGTGSLTYGPSLVLGYKMVGNVDITYGFDMTVPDGAKVWLDVGDPSRSNATGFQHTNVDVIPFNSSAKIQSLELQAALRSTISIKFDFEDISHVSGSASAAVYVDTPALMANITPMSHVDTHCQHLTTAHRSNIGFLDVLKGVIRITMFSAWAFGYGMEAEAEVFELSTGPLGDSWNQTSKPSPLYKACLNFNKKTESYEPAEEAVTKAKAEAKAKAEQKAESNVASTCLGSTPVFAYVLFFTASLYSML